MENYIALLRGINVSGKNSIKMEDLRKLLDKLMFTNVQTYIQSGNILFNYKKEPNHVIEKIISDAIEEHYGYKIAVVARTLNELQKIIKENPFKDISEADFNKLLVVFLNKIPENEKIESLKAINSESELYEIKSNVVYLFCKQGYGNAKVNNNFLESKLKIQATTRNWKTVLKLNDILSNS